MNTGIYKIEHLASGKLYVGSSVDLRRRLRHHKQHLIAGTHHSVKLQRAWNKYGADAFEFSTLLICAPEHLLDYEQRCIDGFDSVVSGYNNNPTAGSSLGRPCGPETREKIRAANTGKPSHMRGKHHSNEAKLKLAEAAKGNKHMLGRKHSEESKRKLSAAHKGKTASDETKAKLSAAFKGRKFSDEHREKLSQACKGKKIGAGVRKAVADANAQRVWTDEARKAMSEAKRAENLDPETRAKMSAAHKGRPKSPEHREKMRAASEARRGVPRSAETIAKMVAGRKLFFAKKLEMVNVEGLTT